MEQNYTSLQIVSVQSITSITLFYFKSGNKLDQMQLHELNLNENYSFQNMSNTFRLSTFQWSFTSHDWEPVHGSEFTHFSFMIKHEGDSNLLLRCFAALHVASWRSFMDWTFFFDSFMLTTVLNQRTQ